MRGPTVSHRLEYLVFRAVRAALRAMPEPWALGLGAFLGWLTGAVLRVRRSVVDENLGRAFPDRDARWRRTVAVGSYRHLGREAVATFRFSGESAEALVARSEVHGLEALEQARAEGRGGIVVTGHLGNWEMGGAALAARGVPVDAVAFRQRNPLFDRDLEENRGRLGMRVVPRGRAHRAVFESLRTGRVPALVADQNAGERGLFVDFFGVPASTARGPAVFSLRSGAPIFLGVALAVPGRPHRYRVHLEEVAVDRSGDVGTDVWRLTAAQTRVLERWVREQPDQYFWQHKRWKTRPPGGTYTRNRSPSAGL